LWSLARLAEWPAGRAQRAFAPAPPKTSDLFFLTGLVDVDPPNRTLNPLVRSSNFPPPVRAGKYDRVPCSPSLVG
jgi:hypothetical protein